MNALDDYASQPGTVRERTSRLERWGRRVITERAILSALTIVIFAGLAWAGLRVLAMPAAVPATAPPDQFSSARAFEHSKMIARAPHPTGSVENAHVRDYIVEQIRSFGLQPEIQKTVAVHPEWGTAFQIENILVRLPGRASTRAMLMVAHYDGIASGPGAGDNGVSVAAMMEAIRTLHARDQLRNDIIFFFPDAEEYGLVGANAFLEEHPWAREVGVVFNFDASDGRGPLVLQHTAEDDGWLVRNLAAADAGAFLKSQQNSERYERWGQDFDVFEEAGYTAANMNNWTNGAYYHTRLDNVENLDERKLQNYGIGMVQVAQHFGTVDLRATRESDRVFTSLFDKNLVVHYPNSWTWPLTLLATAGVVAVLALGIHRRRLSPMALATSTGALAALIVASMLVSGFIWEIIVGTHPEAHWQQELDIYQGRLLLDGVLMFVVAAFLVFFAWGARRFGIATIQAGALVLTGLLALFAAATDPLFNYLALGPLFAVTGAAAITFVIPADETGRHRWLLAAVFWLAAVPVLGLFIPMLARFVLQSSHDGPVLAAAVVILVSAMLAPAIAIAIPKYRIRLAGLAVVIGIALLAVGTARSDFTADQPLPHTLFYVLNANSGSATWATLDDEPDEWIAQFVPPATAQPTTAEAVLGIPASPLDDTDWLILSSAARASDAPVLDVPAPKLEVLADRRDGDLRTLRLRVTSPRSGRLVYVVPDTEVVSASVERKPINVYPGWRFIFVGLPAEGVEVELVLHGNGPTRLTVIDQTDGLPAVLRARYSPEPENTMPAILPHWARGYPTFVSETYVVD